MEVPPYSMKMLAPSDFGMTDETTVQERAGELLDSGQWTDCTFVFPTNSETDAVDSKNTLKAHKIFLAIASPVFAAQFYGNIGDKKSPIIIRDIDLSTFSSLLRYMYTDEVYIPTPEDAMDIYSAANKYLLKCLKNECITCLMNDDYEYTNHENVCQIYEFACFFDEKELEKKCLEMFSTKTEWILKGNGFLNAEVNTLKKIVSMDSLNIKSEIDLFNALEKYVDNFKMKQDSGAMHLASHSSLSKPEEAKQILKGAFEQIRLLSISPEDLIDICCSSILTEEEKSTVFGNVFFKTEYPMPAGFSCIREPRIRTSATIQHTVHNVTTMSTGVTTVSQICYLRKLPWRIVAKRESIPEEQKKLYNSECCLKVFLETNTDNLPNISEDWSCKIRGQLLLKVIINNRKMKWPSASFEETFCKMESSQAIGYYDWEQLIDPKNKLIKDDSITIVAHLTIESIRGADLM
ncbi:BTB/POZ domain-containing protein [Phthorimaea operculella]|nr:BTB/POZ domain-containing protein [Phthorimaea operculella]